MRPPDAVAWVVAAATGCGEAAAPAAAATPVCGEPGPQLLLPLPEREYVEIGHDTTLLLSTVTYDASTPPRAIASRLFATDSCGMRVVACCC